MKNPLLMTRQEKLRVRIPGVDEENPFCQERRICEEERLMALNRNPMLHGMASHEMKRSASFCVDKMAASASFTARTQRILNKTLGPSAGAYILGAAHTGQDSITFDIRQDTDINPELEPYRREISRIKGISFGHRPGSGQRTFNPGTMSTGTINPATKKPFLKRSRTRSGSGSGKVGLSCSELKQLLSSRRVGGLTHSCANRSAFSTGASPSVLNATSSSEGLGWTKQINDINEGVGCASSLHQDSNSLHQDSDGINQKACQSSMNCDTFGGPFHDSMADIEPFGADGAKDEPSRLLLGLKRMSGEELYDWNTTAEQLMETFDDSKRPRWDSNFGINADAPVKRAVAMTRLPDPDESMQKRLSKSQRKSSGIPINPITAKPYGLGGFDHPPSDLPCGAGSAGRWGSSLLTPRAHAANAKISMLLNEKNMRDKRNMHAVRCAKLHANYRRIPDMERAYQATLAKAKKDLG
ncbi:unnamed protein product [Chrysoparadoxa australica]